MQVGPLLLLLFLCTLYSSRAPWSVRDPATHTLAPDDHHPPPTRCAGDVLGVCLCDWWVRCGRRGALTPASKKCSTVWWRSSKRARQEGHNVGARQLHTVLSICRSTNEFHRVRVIVELYLNDLSLLVWFRRVWFKENELVLTKAVFRTKVLIELGLDEIFRFETELFQS